MIANARMYSVSPHAAAQWRALLRAVIARAGLDIRLIEHAEPEPIGELWKRPDMAGVFMCGLPYSLSHPRPALVAAPIPSAPEFNGRPEYWSELVVREDRGWHTVEDTFGGRIALTLPDSQSGCLAVLHHLMHVAHEFPLYREVITPRITPLGALSAVVDGTADVAPVDAYAYRLLQKYRADLTSQLRTVARTAPTPIPALVASGPGLEALSAALLDAHRIESTHELMQALLIERFTVPDPHSYEVLRRNYEATMRYWRAHPLATTIHPAFR